MGAYDQDPGVQGMLAWQAGDETAFDRLVEDYSPKVYSLLTRFLGPNPKREDMVQEVFLRVVRARERYEPTARFSTWIYRIVFNLAVNETQRGRKHQSLDGDDDPDSGQRSGLGLEPVDDREELPSDTLEREDVVSTVRAAIAALPENQRMALVLAKYHDMPYTEIAEVMESTEKAIKSLVHRGRERLRETLSHLMTEEML